MAVCNDTGAQDLTVNVEEEGNSKLVSGSHAKIAFELFAEMRESDELCDITLRVEEREIRAHRVVLAACSPYFRAMLTAGFLESDMESIKLCGLNAAAVGKVVDYCYYKTIMLTSRNIELVLEAAALLQIPELVDECAAFLQGEITLENCLGIQSLANQHSLNTLKAKVAQFVSWNFKSLCNETEFLLLPPQQICEILHSDTLHIDGEAQVFQAVVRWYKQDFDERCKYPEVMEKVRFPCLDLQYLQNEVLDEDIIHFHPKWVELVTQAITYLSSNSTPSQLAENYIIRHRQSPSVVYLVSTKTERIEVFDFDKGTCVPVQGMSLVTGNAVKVNGDMYVVVHGGLMTHKFIPRANLWSTYLTGFKEHDSVVLEGNGYIFVIGGGKKAKFLDPKPRNCSWTKLPSMTKWRSYHAAAHLNSRIYAAGGVSIPGNVPISDVECLDLASMQWSMVTPMLTPRCRHRAIAYDGCVYVLGGTDLTGTALASVEMFDPDEGRWTEVAPLNHARRDFGVAVMAERILVFGGMGSNSVECYDKAANKWVTVGNLQRRWSEFNCVVYPMFQSKKTA